MVNINKKEENNNSSMVEGTGTGSYIVNVLLAILLLGIAFICLIPLWHVLMASLSEGKKLLAHEGLLWLPVGKANLEAYKILFADAGIIKGYLNTLIYVVGATGIGLVINLTGGYVLSRDTKLKAGLTLFVMFTMLFNGGLIPTFMVIRSLGMIGTRLALLIPGCTNAIFLIMMMNGFRQVPESTIEAARIDGAGHLRVLFQVMLPQARSMMLVIVISSVVVQWNAWFSASIYVPNNRDIWPLQLWIKQIVADNAGIMMNSNPDYSRWLVQYAVIIAATLPILIAFPFFQKKLEKGMLMGGVKE